MAECAANTPAFVEADGCVRLCRCDAIPWRALQTAGALFRRQERCRASGDYSVNMTRAFAEQWRERPHRRRRRRLLAPSVPDSDSFEPDLQDTFAAGSADGADNLASGDTALRQYEAESSNGGMASGNGTGPGPHGRHLLQGTIPMEYGPEHQRKMFSRAINVMRVQRANLHSTGWMGSFEPMMPSCPLTARKVAPEAVSDFAALAWRCDGLGFAWECLQQQGVLQQAAGSTAQPQGTTNEMDIAADDGLQR